MAEYSIARAKNELPKLIRAAEAGETVILTRHGAPVARIEKVHQRRPIRLGTMRGEIELLPGWDEPLFPDEAGEGAG